MAKLFLDKFNEIGNINLALQAVIENFNLNDTLIRDIYNNLIRVINKVIGVNVSSKENMYKLLNYLFMSNDIENNYYDNAIEIISLSNYLCSDNDYVLMNFNDESCPRKFKDKNILMIH